MNKVQSNIVFGIHAVIEALDAGREIEKVLLKRNSEGNELQNQLRRRLHEENIPFQFVPAEKLNTITKKNHQGVIAFVSSISYGEIEFILPTLYEKGRVPLILILDQVSDVRNFGAIARTAECADVDAIVIPFKGSALINAEAVKTSAGALFNIPVCRVRDLKDLLKYLKNSGIQIFAASEKADMSLYDADFSVPLAIVMGSEGKGISPGLMPFIDYHVSIPQKGKISSLNVSVAAGVILYEALRQRTK